MSNLNEPLNNVSNERELIRTLNDQSEQVENSFLRRLKEIYDKNNRLLGAATAIGNKKPRIEDISLQTPSQNQKGLFDDQELVLDLTYEMDGESKSTRSSIDDNYSPYDAILSFGVLDIKGNKVRIPIPDGYTITKVNEIMFIKSKDVNTYFFLTNGTIHRSNLTLGAIKEKFEEIFKENNDFIKLNRSYYINRNYVISRLSDNLVIKLPEAMKDRKVLDYLRDNLDIIPNKDELTNVPYGIQVVIKRDLYNKIDNLVWEY